MEKKEPVNPIIRKIASLKSLLASMEGVKDDTSKSKILQTFDFENIIERKEIKKLFEFLKNQDQFLIRSFVAIEQGPILVAIIELKKEIPTHFLALLREIDSFYAKEFGLIYYQLHFLEHLLENQNAKNEREEDSLKNQLKNYLKPPKIDLREDTREVRASIRQAIENLDKVGEIYPLGGAGERLALVHPKTKEPLPVALLNFLGATLLEGLIRDLVAKEFLYYKLTKKELVIPVAFMTSEEQDREGHEASQNHSQILSHLEKNNWFNRPQDFFFPFTQPLVPLVTDQGEWILSEKSHLLLKPNGHGVIWKLALEKGVLSWFKKLKRKKLVTRQINNPLAGVDNTLLAFIGHGFQGDYLFGFSSCDRLLNSSEGMDVLIEEKKEEDGKSFFEYKIVNIEYTELLKNKITDRPENEGEKISKFPANTNILFVDIENVEKLVKKCPIPGLLINMKSHVTEIDERGLLKLSCVGRLESTMQNIADQLTDQFSEKWEGKNELKLKSFLTYQERIKTISVTKKSYKNGEPQSFLETPESAFYDLLNNHHELFTRICKFDLPGLISIEGYLEKGPSCVIMYHPALGPLYSIIGQKIRGGKLYEGAELQLEIAELELENLILEGSLLIETENVTGVLDEKGILRSGKGMGVAVLKNVKVKNRGIKREAKNCYWKNEIERLEALRIKIKGNGELIAENVTFVGNREIVVENGERVTVSSRGETLEFQREKIEKENNNYWNYSFDEEDRIIVRKISQTSKDERLTELKT